MKEVKNVVLAQHTTDLILNLSRFNNGLPAGIYEARVDSLKKRIIICVNPLGLDSTRGYMSECPTIIARVKTKGPSQEVRFTHWGIEKETDKLVEFIASLYDRGTVSFTVNLAGMPCATVAVK